jgi:hypothetical protein
MKIALPIFCIVLLTACLQQDAPPSSSPYQNSMNLSPAYLASLDTANYTIIQWLDSVQDFGTIHEGDSVKLNYRFKNIGGKPLFLENVKTSCGCTVTKFPENAIFPGKENSVSVTFNSSGHPGQIFKNIAVVANTSNRVKHFIYFKGTVVAKK